MRFIAVICGLKSEAAVVRDAAAQLPADAIRIGVSGADAARAAAIAAEFCANGARAVLSVGVSGGLDPALVPGDLIVTSRVMTTQTGEIAVTPLAGAAGAGGDAPLILGSDAIIASATEKARLARLGAAAVDMESHGVAQASAATGTAFLAVRAIADPAHRALPRAALGAVNRDGSTRIISTLTKCLARPGDFPALLRIGADSAAAHASLRRDLGVRLGAIFFGLDP